MDLLAVSPFDGLSPWQTAGFAAAYVLAFFIKGVFGYGAVPTLVVVGSLVASPHHVVLLAAISNLFTHAQFVPEGFRHGNRALALGLVAFFLPTIAVGVWLFQLLDSDRLSLIAGILIFLIVLIELFGLSQRLAPAILRYERISGPVAASTAGLISGLIGAGAMVFLSVYIRLFCPEKRTFRATVILVASIIIGWRSLILIGSGMIDGALLVEAALLAPLALIAGAVGQRVMLRMPNEAFFRLYQGLLAFGAVLLILRGLK